MNVLFICNQNQHRSKTAEIVFKNKFNTKSAGLYNETPVSKEQIEWADIVVVMEEDQRSKLGKRFPELYLKKGILCLDIPDIYAYDDPKLIDLLKSKFDEQIQLDSVGNLNT